MYRVIYGASVIYKFTHMYCGTSLNISKLRKPWFQQVADGGVKRNLKLLVVKC